MLLKAMMVILSWIRLLEMQAEIKPARIILVGKAVAIMPRLFDSGDKNQYSGHLLL